MLEKVSVVDKIEVLESGFIQVRRANKIMEDGKEIAKTYYRHILSPGDDITNETEEVAKIAAAIWTDAKIKQYKYKYKIKENYNGNTK